MLTDENVLQYLQQSPDFAIKHSEVLERLLSNTSFDDTSDNVTFLLDIQNKRLKAEVNALKKQLNDVMIQVEANETLLSCMIDLQKKLFQCQSFDQVIKHLDAYAEDRQLRCHFFVVGNNEFNVELSAYQETITTYINQQGVYLGRLKSGFQKQLFSTEVTPLGSFIILPIERKYIHALLIFSNENGGYFSPTMDTTFIRYLAEVVGYLFESLPKSLPMKEVL